MTFEDIKSQHESKFNTYKTENDLNNLFDPYSIIDSSNRKNLLRAMKHMNMLHIINISFQIISKNLKVTLMLKNSCLT